ncbi:MAG: hypothetical protein A4E35_02367 [Methanoregula sp. PtaU1.Bin051]|nr:MAG: hypothetical protein A4E35_02367 [Methanoregula sp. PtaU1.Bin051]
MGASTDIMHDFAAQEIKRIYSNSDGWTVTSRNQANNYDTVFRLERFNQSRREIVKVGVTFAKEVNPELLAALQKAESSSDGMPSRFSYSLIVPANTDTSSLPGGVIVNTMRSFAYDGDALVWLKRPIRKTDDSSKKAVAT